MDGMFDAYTLAYMRDYRSARDLEPGWQDFIQKTDARAALLREGGPLAFAMMETPELAGDRSRRPMGASRGSLIQASTGPWWRSLSGSGVFETRESRSMAGSRP